MRQECCSVFAGMCCLSHIGLALAKDVKSLILHQGSEFYIISTGSVCLNQDLCSLIYSLMLKDVVSEEQILCVCEKLTLLLMVSRSWL